MEIQRFPVIIAGELRNWGKSTIVTGAKGFVFLGGAVGIEMDTGAIPEGIGEQTRMAMEHVREALEECGSSLENIVFFRRYVKGQFPNGILNDSGYLESMNVLQEFWKENCPQFLAGRNPSASSLIGVTALAFPELKIEIEVVAAIP